jgi:hypothetical protein
MTNRDARYDLINPMFYEGKIITFSDIFKFIPKTVVANDLAKKVDHFTGLMNRIEEFTLEELFIIAKFCDLNESQILKLAENEYLINKCRILRSPKTRIP